MKLLTTLFGIILTTGFVSAIGLPVPVEFNEKINVYYGGADEYLISVIGDSNTNEVIFFVKPLQPGYISINGDDDYYEELILDPYQKKEFLIELEGINEINPLMVEYGVSIKNSDSTEFGFEQVVSSSFEVRVRCNGNNGCENSINSGSGGSGNSVSIAVEESQVQDADATSSDSNSLDDANIDDITPQNTALNQAVVDTKEKTLPQSNPSITFDASDTITTPEEKGVALTVLVLMVFMLLVNYAAINELKKEELK